MGDAILIRKRKRGDDSPGDAENVGGFRKRPSVQLGSGSLFAVDDFPSVSSLAYLVVIEQQQASTVPGIGHEL